MYPVDILSSDPALAISYARDLADSLWRSGCCSLGGADQLIGYDAHSAAHDPDCTLRTFLLFIDDSP